MREAAGAETRCEEVGTFALSKVKSADRRTGASKRLRFATAARRDAVRAGIVAAASDAGAASEPARRDLPVAGPEPVSGVVMRAYEAVATGLGERLARLHAAVELVTSS